MYTLAAGEKATLVMAYTETMLVRGEVITTENIRVNTWLRTAGVPEYMHILRAQILIFPTFLGIIFSAWIFIRLIVEFSW